MVIISLILFVLGIYSFNNGKKHLTLLVIAILSTSYFDLYSQTHKIGSISIQPGDLALLTIFLLLPISYRLNNDLSKLRFSFLIFFIFLIISTSYDIYYRGTSIMQVFRTTRKVGYLLFFFLISAFSKNDYLKFLKILLKVTIIHAILYIGQYIFKIPITPDSYFVTGKDFINGLRFYNTPFFIIPMIVLCLFYYKRYRTYLLILFFLNIFLSQGRGAMISLVVIVLCYFVFKKRLNITKVLINTSFVTFAFFLLLSAIPSVSTRFIHLKDELLHVGVLNTKNIEFMQYGGTLLFRLGLTFERVLYVMEDTTRMILGCGYVPDFDIIKPIFVLGTFSPTLPSGFEQYNSIDIFFPNIITRYGFLGSVIFIFMLITLFSYSFKNKVNEFGIILFVYMISMAIISLVNETFYNGQYFFIIFVFIGIINNKSKLLETNKQC